MNNGLKYALIFLGGALFGGLAQAALRVLNGEEQVKDY